MPDRPETQSKTEREDAGVVLQWYYDQYQYIHDLFWRLFFRFSGVVLFLLIIPLVYPIDFPIVGEYAWFFPVAAIASSVIGSWILGAHYVRLKGIIARMDEARKLRFPDIEAKRGDYLWLFHFRIGAVVSWALVVGGVGLSAFEFWLLWGGVGA